MYAVDLLSGQGVLRLSKDDFCISRMISENIMIGGEGRDG